MGRRGDGDDDDMKDVYEDQEALDDEEEEEEEEDDEEQDYHRVEGSSRKRRRSDFIDDVAEEEDEDDDDYGRKGKGRHKAKKRSGSEFFDLEAQVDSDEEEEEEEGGDDDFIVDGGDLPDEDDGARIHRRPLLPREDEQEDFEALARRIQARYARSSHTECDEEITDVEQQALLPSVRDPSLFMVKCVIGRGREVAGSLMRKCLRKGPDELQIMSVIALDHLQNFIYVEADKKAHVEKAIKRMPNIYSNQTILLVPIREMTAVLSVESKAVDLSRDAWVRMKLRAYKGDLAKVVDVDNVRKRITVKLIPRIDLQALANKLEGREVVKKKASVPSRFMNTDEARKLHIPVESRSDSFESMAGMLFKDGFLYKTVSMKSISVQNIKPTFDELEKFRTPGENEDCDIASLSTLFANRKKGHFMKGDAVIGVKGDLKNLKGYVEKVDEEIIHIRPEMKPETKGLPKSLAINEKELCKYFEPGNHVKVVSGAREGATGMVVKVEQHVVTILSDTTKEHIRVFADDVVGSSEVSTGVAKIGDYGLHDLVLLDDLSFGVIIGVESEAFQVLKGIPERPKVAVVKLRDVRRKIKKKKKGQDRYKNTVSVKDVVRILEGPCKGKQGPVEHIYSGLLFIYDGLHVEHGGFVCAKSNWCAIVGGSQTSDSQFGSFQQPPPPPPPPPPTPPSPRRTPRVGGRHRGGTGGRGVALVGTTVKIRKGPYKGYRGRVVDVNGQRVRVELESQMKIVTVDRDFISDNVIVSTQHRDTKRSGMGSETPTRPSRSPTKDPGDV